MKIFLSLLFILFGLQIDAPAKQIKISGNLKNTGAATQVYLFEFQGISRIKADSATLNKGNFNFTFRKALPRGFYSIGTSPEKSFQVILSNESFSVSADLNQLPQSVKTENSTENELLQKFTKSNQELNKKLQQLNQRALGLQQLAQTSPEKYQQQIKALQQTADSLINQQHQEALALAETNKKTFMAKVIRFYLPNQNASPQNFITESQLKDPELWRGDMMYQKISQLFQQHFQPNDIAGQLSTAETLINKTKANSTERILLYESLAHASFYRDKNLARKIVQRFAQDFPQNNKPKQMLASLPSAPPAVGDIAPDITLETPEGRQMSLSELRGQVVLLDFWASWCGPCRRENPNVVAAYQQFKDKGFTVFSVSLDTNRDRWLKAIKHDKMTWHHVSDLKGWQSVGGALYSITAIPATYLIDKDGVIIAQNLRGAALLNKLKEVLK